MALPTPNQLGPVVINLTNWPAQTSISNPPSYNPFEQRRSKAHQFRPHLHPAIYIQFATIGDPTIKQPTRCQRTSSASYNYVCPHLSSLTVLHQPRLPSASDEGWCPLCPTEGPTRRKTERREQHLSSCGDNTTTKGGDSHYHLISTRRIEDGTIYLCHQR